MENSNLSQSNLPQKNKKFKIALKHWTGTLIVAIIAGFVIFIMLNGREFLANYLLSREQKKIQEQFEKPYREDRYGGKTPEETFDMFLNALRKGDIDLASKYFVLNKQEEWREALDKLRDNPGNFEKLIQELEDNRKKWKLYESSEDRVVYRFTYVVETPFVEELPLGNGKTQKLTHPAGEFASDIIFEKNIFSQIWKISVL